MWRNSIWKTLHVLLRLYVSTNPGEDEVPSLLFMFMSSSFKLLEFVGDFWSFHHNFCSAQFTFLQSVLHKNQKTIISLTITCHSICFPSKYLTDRLPKPKNMQEIRENLICWVLSNLVQQIFILDQSATMLHKARQNWTCKGVTLVCHASSFYVFH